MVAFDRSKFNAGSLKDVEETVKKAQQTMGRREGEWVNFFTLEEGKNIIRILPAAKGSPYVALKTAKLQVEVDSKDKDGNVTGKEIKDKNIFCADIHGVDILKGRDPIMTYIKYAKMKAEDIQDADERKRYLNPITGYMSKKGWVWGIEPMLAFVCYIQDGPKGVLKFQLRPQWMKEMKNISVERSEDDALSLDVFSDPDHGYPLLINKYKDEKKKNKFDLSAVLPNAAKRESWDDFFEKNRVPDEVLTKLASLDSLEDTYCNVYKKRDWDWALEGLQRFDEEQGYEIFAIEEFITELEEMAAMIPEDEEKDEEERPAKTVASEKGKAFVQKAVAEAREEIKRPAAVTQAQTVSQYPPLIKLKSYLRDYIKDVYGDDMELPESLSIVELRDWYDLAQQNKELPLDGYADGGDNLPFDEASSTQAENPVEEAKTDLEDKTLQTAKSRLASIRPRK
jgi:hypothetical protein